MRLSPNQRPFRSSLGQRGEMIAWDYLSKCGYRIVERNFRCALGEIDIIAREGQTMVFIEVKTRTSHRFGLPEEAVGERKQAKLIRLAEWYLKEKDLYEAKVRFDVLSISLREQEEPVIRLIRNAFGVEAE